MKDQYIAAKERWARKMAGQAKPAARSTDRLPPGQRPVHNFPVLDLGVRPEIPLDRWELKIHGHVGNPATLSWEQFLALPQFKDLSDFHCVTTWSQFDMDWEGVAFFTVADLVKPRAEATHVFFKSYDGYSTNNPLDVCMDDDVLIAHKWNGQPLSKEHGGPARLIIPKRYAWKGAKFIREIVFLDRDILGFWEVRGYSNTADPWAEDRFARSPGEPRMTRIVTDRLDRVRRNNAVGKGERDRPGRSVRRLAEKMGWQIPLTEWCAKSIAIGASAGRRRQRSRRPRSPSATASLAKA